MPVRSFVPAELYPRIQPRDPLVSPVDEMARVLDQPPPVSNAALPGDSLLTGRWIHGEMHDHMKPMSGHVVMTYYGATRDIAWREGADRRSTRTRPGAITLIPAGHAGKWDIKGPIEVAHVYLTDERLRLAAEGLYKGKPIELMHRVVVEDPTAAGIMRLLSNEPVTSEHSSKLFVEQAIDLLCTQLIREHSTASALKPVAPPRGLADWQVKKVTSYMEEYFNHEIGIQELADLVGLSRFHFATAFKLATGQAPHAWLTDLRMTRARQLLGRPGVAVTSIAMEVGYQTPSSFAAAFRKNTGLTPSEYRRLL